MPDSPPADIPPSRPWLRPVIALGTFFGIIGLLHAAGVLDDLSPETVRVAVAQAGPLAAVAFVGIYIAGILLQVPGWVFIGAGVLAWGKPIALVLSYISSVSAAVIAFAAFRRAGGQPIEKAQRPWVQKLLNRIERSPFKVVLALRLVFVVSPPLNFALALTPVSLKDYTLGTVLGILPPLAIMVAMYGLVLD